MDRVVVSALFANTEDSEMFECSQGIDKCGLKEICEDIDLMNLCEEAETNIKLFDPTYDDEMYQICALVENNMR